MNGLSYLSNKVTLKTLKFQTYSKTKLDVNCLQ